MRPRVKGALLLLLAFLLGAAAGASGFGFYLARTWGWGQPRGAHFQQFILRRLDRELGLAPEQRRQVEAILRDTGEDFARLRAEMRPRFREILARARERIQATLDGEQRTKFEALAEEWERRRDRWRADLPAGAKGRGPGPADGGPGIRGPRPGNGPR